MIVSDFRAVDAVDAVDPSAKIEFLSVHLPLDTLVLFLTIARICWWIFPDRKPDPLAMLSWQVRISTLVHTSLYIVILGMAASGISMIVLSGAAPIISGEAHNHYPTFGSFYPEGLIAWALD